MFFLEASKHPELDADVEAEGSHHVEADVEVFRSAEALDLVAEKIRLLTTASQGPVGRALAQHPWETAAQCFFHRVSVRLVVTV